MLEMKLRKKNFENEVDIPIKNTSAYFSDVCEVIMKDCSSLTKGIFTPGFNLAEQRMKFADKFMETYKEKIPKNPSELLQLMHELTNYKDNDFKDAYQKRVIDRIFTKLIKDGFDRFSFCEDFHVSCREDNKINVNFVDSGKDPLILDGNSYLRGDTEKHFAKIIYHTMVYHPKCFYKCDVEFLRDYDMFPPLGENSNFYFKEKFIPAKKFNNMRMAGNTYNFYDISSFKNFVNTVRESNYETAGKVNVKLLDNENNLILSRNFDVKNINNQLSQAMGI